VCHDLSCSRFKLLHEIATYRSLRRDRRLYYKTNIYQMSHRAWYTPRIVSRFSCETQNQKYDNPLRPAPPRGGNGWPRDLWISLVLHRPQLWGCRAKRLVWIILVEYWRYLCSQKNSRDADYIWYYIPIGRTTTCRYYIYYTPPEKFTHIYVCVAIHA